MEKNIYELMIAKNIPIDPLEDIFLVLFIRNKQNIKKYEKRPSVLITSP